MSHTRFPVCIAALVALVVLSTAPAHASSLAAAPSPETATFEGHSLDLAAGWGSAHDCLVWQRFGVVECFRTEAELAAREVQVKASGRAAAAARATAATPTCSASLDLYSGRNYTGLHLALRDEGYWQELSYFGFDNMTVSFLGGACSFHLAQNNWGQGYWYPGNTGAWSTALDMGSWDDTVSSVYIN
jgi:hypothetical protein